MAVADPEDAEEAVVELDSDDSDAAGGTEDETPNDVAGTDDDVPTGGGENYFGRAAKEGAAPVGANPFAMPAPSADDDWMREIAEAKRMVEAQRIKREREEAVERQKEIEAAEAKGKVYEERRKAGDSPAPVSGTGGQGGRRERKIVRAKRPTGGGGPSGMTPTSGGDGGGGGGGASPFAAFSFAPPPASTPVRTEDTPVAASPFNVGFSLLSTHAEAKPGGGGGIMSRLSGAPKPFVEPEPEPEPEEEEEEEEEPKAAPFSFQAAPAPVAPPKSTPAPTPAPKSTTSAPGRTALAVELDL